MQNANREKWRITIKVQQKFSRRNLLKRKFNANFMKVSRANDGIWTRGLFLTKETLYPWATPAKIFRAGDRVRTGDIQLGRLTLYQLSYSRNTILNPVSHKCGESRIRTCEVKKQQIYSLSSLAAWVSPLNIKFFQYFKNVSRWRDSNPRPADYKSAALASWATSAMFEVFTQQKSPLFLTDCKCIGIF